MKAKLLSVAVALVALATASPALADGSGGSGGAQAGAQNASTNQGALGIAASNQNAVNANVPVSIAGGNVSAGPSTATQNATSTATADVSNKAKTDQDQNLTQNVVEFQNYSQCVDALRSGQVDAVTTDNAILAGYAAQAPDQLRVGGQTFSQEPYGVGMNRDDVALRNKVNDLLQAAENDGTWQRLYNETLGRSGTPAPPPPAIQRY